MRNRNKKILVLIILGIYLITNFFQSMIYSGNKVYAARNQLSENQIDYTNIVAIIVDDTIYDNLKNDIQRYATDYIQGDTRNKYNSISNSQALIFPINTENFSPKNITQLLENMYFGWIDWKTSRLVWLVLIWDIPLPVVNQNWYIYPTIYPYVDFEEQKFIWDEESQYFVYNNNPNWQAEIWHWMINFDTIDEYKDYYEKLREYWDNPSSFVDKAIWYEDFIGNTRYFNDNSLNAYLNNFIFAEDLWYHRYSDLMVKVLQWQRNKEMSEFLEEFNEVFPDSEWTGLDAAMAALSSSTDMNTPTMQIKAVIDNWYLDGYTSLFGQKYLKIISDNVETANRWLETLSWSEWAQHYVDALDAVYKMVELNDDIALRTDWSAEPFMIMINNALEESVDAQVESGKYRLDEVIPLTYLNYKWITRWLLNNKCVWEIYDAYENYYFGTNARYLQWMEDTSTYRWTYRNYDWIDGLTIQNIQNSENPATDIDIDLNKKSIWWSYEIFAQQVDANRWYNYNNSILEYQIYSGNKTAKKENRGINCVKRVLWLCIKNRWSISDHNGSGCDLSEGGDQWWCEDPTEYAVRIRWWASPLNLDAWVGWSFVWKSGYTYTGAIGKIFDIAWSTALETSEYESNSFESIDKYSTLTLRRFSPNVPNWPKMSSANPLKKAPDSYGFWYDYSMDYEVKFANQVPVFGGRRWREILRRTETGVLSAADVDYFDNYNPITTVKQWNIIKTSKTIPWWNIQCWWAWQIYTYSTLDSRVKNDSVNAEEVNWDSYEVFTDNRSPSKQFYEELMGYMDSVSGTVNAIVGNDSGSLLGYLTQIKNDIDSINGKFQDLIDFDVNEISWDITQLAEDRESIFTEEDSTNLLNEIKNAQDAVLDLSGFIDMWDTMFDGVLNFIDEQYALFNVNWWELIFLDSWKNNIFDTTVWILEKFKKLQEIAEQASIQYIGINYLWYKSALGLPTPISMDVPHNLAGKIISINGLIQNQSGQDIWCETWYKELCEALSHLLRNYNGYVDTINNEKDGINDIVTPIFDDDGEQIWTGVINNIFAKLIAASVFSDVSNAINIITNIWLWIWLSLVLPVPGIWLAPSLLNDEDTPIQKMYKSVYSIPSTWNDQLTWFIPWMNNTTSDRPIDSPRYLTFKWISGDKVTFIYPDIYKAEIFSGDSEDGMLTLKKPEEIAEAIKDYLKKVVKQYNKLLLEQLSWHNQYYNQNKDAFDTLSSLDSLASPVSSDRSYRLFSSDYLIKELERKIKESPFFTGDDLAQSDPILFVSNIIYYQNIAWPEKTISGTIQWDFDNQRTDFDINEKISYLMDNYLIADNNRWNYITPNYRDSWYEVAYINSDGNDYLVYEVTPPNEEIQNAASNFVSPTQTMDLWEEDLITECNIPIDWWVLLFQLSGNTIETPWFDALKCRWEKIKEKPIEFKITFPFTWDTWTDFLHNMYNFFDWDEYKDIWLTYKNQLSFLNTNEINNEIISNMELSNPWDAAKLQEILSYTMITTDKANIYADNPNGEIEISSSKALWDVQFHIIAAWNNSVRLEDWDSLISKNITIWQEEFSTWNIHFEPYNWRTLHYSIENPTEWYNILMFYMCLPGTNNLENCVRKSIKFDVVPWSIKNISIQPDYNIVLEWASVPFKVEWTDQFGNNVWELIAQKFLASVSSWNITLNNSTTSTGIRFSDFNNANFTLNATGWDLDWKIITIQVSWYIDWEPGIKDSTWVKVVKWRIDVYSGNTKLSSGASVITWISVKLPDKDIYYSIDTNMVNQLNTGVLPKVQLKLVDKNGALISISWKVTVKTKNWKLSPWNINQKTVTKNINWNVVDVEQYTFAKTSYFELSGGYINIYLLPSFSAWEDVLNISMPGVDDIHIPIYVDTASPSIVKLSTESEVLHKNSSTNVNLKVFDNWNNLIDKDVLIKLDSSSPNRLSLSAPRLITVHGWSFDFEAISHDKGWWYYIYAQIDPQNVPLSKQSPWILSMTIQENMLPEEKLNVMYLNLFGGDWWNQWWYMSDNERYSESLIKNSDKLLTITTQLLDYENIKFFPVIIDKFLRIRNFGSNDITFSLDSWFSFNVKSIWKISIPSDTFKLEEALISDDEIDFYIANETSQNNKGKWNKLYYIPEQIDSILSGNEVRNSAIYINWEKVFSLRDFTFSQNLDIRLTEDRIAWYQVREVFFDDVFAWKMLFAIDPTKTIDINLSSYSDKYWVWETWINWSSNEYGWWFYQLDSELPKATFGYKSIQDSYDTNLWIWFTADFKNITNFGWGMPVWEATLPFSSELLINIWDPLLKRIDENNSAKVYDGSWNIVKDTEFDLWPWEVIYSEPGKEIFKVINIDFNNDDLEDIIVIFKDWTIKILKNYWWTNPFQNLWALMILADRINDVSIWDVDGNQYEDLLIRTEAGWLRVYLNNKWVFDVDGYPVCINVNVDRWEISEHPENIAWIHQIFLEDMDNDWALDIVTNDDLWFIKIFYGGIGADWVVNYLSTNKYMCDDGRYQRINRNNNSKIVYQFGITAYSGHVLDQSLIHWQWISGPEPWDITLEDLWLEILDDSNSVGRDTLNLLIKSLWVLNNTSIVEDLYKQNERLKQAWFDVIPVYETWIASSADIDYVEIWCLTWQDPVKIYKTYENLKDNPIDRNWHDDWMLVNWDLVRVNVYIEAKDNFSWTFIDNILWPWLIPLSEYNDATFENYWFDESYVSNWYITSWQIQDLDIHWDLDNARYMIDNIHMNRWDKIKFSYWLIYNNTNSIMDISIEALTWRNFSDYLLTWWSLNGYLDHDQYLDISVQPVDGCNDSMFIFFNKWSQANRNPRSYEQKYIDLGKLMAAYYESANENQENTINNLVEPLSDVENIDEDNPDNETVQEIASYVYDTAGVSEKLNWYWMLTSEWIEFGWSLDYGWNNETIKFMIEKSNDIVNKIDKFIWSACNWKKTTLESLWLGSLKPCSWWLPVPFNQALLWEWKYHAFGCFEIPFLSETIGKWMPVLHAPAMWWSYPAVWFFWIPSYWPTFDGFYWLWSPSTLDSYFRLYLMPTMTMKLGIALCFWPYNMGWIDFWDPLGDIAWNCVVFAVDMPCGKKDNWEGENAMTDVPDWYTLLNGCSKQNVPCYVWDNESSSPFLLWGASENMHSLANTIIPDGSYAGWFINIEVTPQSYSPYQERSTLDMETITMKWWATIQNKIRWSTEQWIIDVVVKKWLDKQIKYIMNNLTNFKVSVIFPDLQKLVGNIDVNKFSEFTGQYNNTPKERCENRWMQRNPNDQTCTKKISQNFESEALNSVDERSQKNLLSRQQISSRSEYTNPFKELAEAFNDTPLVNISTKTYTINVPILSSEDITSYLSMSNSWINRQTQIMEEWKEFFAAIIWVCGWRTNINDMKDLEEAVQELNERFKDAQEYSDWDEGDQAILQNLQWKIDALKNMKQKYNLSDLWEYKLYEAKSWWFYIMTQYRTPASDIQPKDVYIFFDPGSSNLSMFTSWFDLITDSAWSKIKVSIKENSVPYSNTWLSFNQDKQAIRHSCAALFNWDTMNNSLKWFLNLSATLDKLVIAVKQNMETLQQYKKFPLQLYDWIHVIDRYLWDTSSLVSSTFGTLSIWMETNANRFSQYVDALITLTTTLETYQMIIDLSKDWTESCSTCTNDNYDQFSCKLWGICNWLDIELPIVEIPPTKIPSLYLDFSEVHVESDITLPNLTFNPVAVPLPQLPNIPSPPDLDLSLGLDEAMAFGIDLIWQLMGIDFSSLSLDIWDIPLIPSPPTLPELPSFIPTVEMELPLLPPAPKIPQLPDSIKGAIKGAKLIWKILCIIKWKIGLVEEKNIKAKVEQITQRTYEVPYWDNFDQTLSERNTFTSSNISSTLASVFSWFTALLQTNQFKEVKMKWFDLSLQTYINIQFNLDEFHDWLKSVIFWDYAIDTNTAVNWINRATNYVTKREEQWTNYVSEQMGKLSKWLQSCVNEPISIDCLWDDASDMVEDYEKWKSELGKTKKLIEEWAEWLSNAVNKMENKKDEVQNLLAEISGLNNELVELNERLDYYRMQLNSATTEQLIRSMTNEINNMEEQIQNKQAEIDAVHERIEVLEGEIAEIGEEYWRMLEDYRELSEFFTSLNNRVQELKDSLLQWSQEVIDQIKGEIEEAWEAVDFDEIKDLEMKINESNSKAERQKEIDKETQLDNLKNLYKDVDLVSYVDYDPEINKNNFEILEDALSEINTQTRSKDLKERSQEYLDLIAMNRNVNANVDSLVRVEKEYNTVIWDYKAENSELLWLIENDYDNFLVAVSNNDKSLVSDKSFDVTLSAKLFDIDENTLSVMSQQDSIMKKYIDYNMTNVNWYLNALENYSAQELNMDEETYKMNKEYLNDIKNMANQAYDIIDNPQWEKNKWNAITLLAQAAWWNAWGQGGWNSNNGWSSSSMTIDVANYIQWNILKTSEWNLILANEDYTSMFQSRFLLADMNNDQKNDMILWDDHNVYIKYKAGNTEYPNEWYNSSSRYYTYHINSYEQLLNDADENWIVKIRDWITHTLKVKLVDENWEVKNFKYVWQTFDSIKVSRSSSDIVWDIVDWYLIKMIHRVDQFNDHENLINQWNNSELFDKKYILVLPKWSLVTWMKLELDNEWTLNNIENHIWTGNEDEIFSLQLFNEWLKTINLTLTDIPRNRQYSEIYTLNFDGNTYKITSSSSNQVVAWPQIIADTEWPDVEIKLYRPATDKVVDEWTNLKWYVWTNYILQAYWEDNVALDEIWIADAMGEDHWNRQININSQTWYIELSWLYFTWSESLHYYLWWVDIDWNEYVEEITLAIDVPSIEITDIIRWNQGLSYLNWNILYNPLAWWSIPNIGDWNNVVSILAELNQDIDSWYIQFIRNRTNDKRESLTWVINWLNIPNFKVVPEETQFYGWYFDLGDDIWLYSVNGDMVAKINPNNWKITITPGFENTISIRLDYSPKIPVVKVMEWNNVLFWVIFSSEELVGQPSVSSNVSIEPLDNEMFGEFYGWMALKKNDTIIMYISPKWQIYTDIPLYWEYWFDDATSSVIYTFRDSPNWSNLWSVKVKIKNLLEY